MKDFCQHIDYLLQKYDCVIIPDFGGFVLHRDHAKFASDGSILAPIVSVGFNPDLKYNDGLLAESFMNAYSISYDIACKRIGDVVQRLNTILGLRQPVKIGNLGTLLVDENKKLAFIPSPDFSANHPETFGLENVNIKRLSDIEQINKALQVSTQKNYYQRLFLGVGATAAAIIIFFLTSTPIKNTQVEDIQKSGFFVDVLGVSTVANNSESVNLDSSTTNTENLDLRGDKVEEAKLAENAITENDLANSPESNISVRGNDALDKVNVLSSSNKDAISVVPDNVSKNISISNTSQDKKQFPKYYIIIGSASSKGEAQRLLTKFQVQGFKSAAIVESKERPRVYVSVFSDKVQAEKYLRDFRYKNPSMSDSWIFTKRN